MTPIVLTYLHAALHTAPGKAALGGAIASLVVDVQAFRKWKSWNDLTTYSWSMASFRWVQGAILGMAAAYGFQALL